MPADVATDSHSFFTFAPINRASLKRHCLLELEQGVTVGTAGDQTRTLEICLFSFEAIFLLRCEFLSWYLPSVTLFIHNLCIVK